MDSNSRSRAIHWRTWKGLVSYREVALLMEKRVNAIVKGEEKEAIWLLEHHSVYTAGAVLGGFSRKGLSEDIKGKLPFPLEQSNRGGRVTYHGPGQRIIYIMLKLEHYKKDVRRFVYLLEEWMIEVLKHWDICGERHADFPGVWVKSEEVLKKIAALGIRIRGGVTFHGIGFNVSVDLTHYDPIVPCGIEGGGICRLNDLIVGSVSMLEVDEVLTRTFKKVLG